MTNGRSFYPTNASNSADTLQKEKLCTFDINNSFDLLDTQYYNLITILYVFIHLSSKAIQTHARFIPRMLKRVQRRFKKKNCVLLTQIMLLIFLTLIIDVLLAYYM